MQLRIWVLFWILFSLFHLLIFDCKGTCGVTFFPPKDPIHLDFGPWMPGICGTTSEGKNRIKTAKARLLNIPAIPFNALLPSSMISALIPVAVLSPDNVCTVYFSSSRLFLTFIWASPVWCANPCNVALLTAPHRPCAVQYLLQADRSGHIRPCGSSDCGLVGHTLQPYSARTCIQRSCYQVRYWFKAHLCITFIIL